MTRPAATRPAVTRPAVTRPTRTLVTLKLRLLRNGLRRSPWQVVSLVLGLLYGLGVAVLAVVGLVALRGAEVGTAAVVVVAAGSLLTLCWAVVPLVAFGTDATLDPARLALVPLPARRLVPGLLLAGVVGVPGVVTTLLGAATVVTWSRGALPVVVAVLGAVLGVLTCVALSRLTTTAFGAALAGRRSKELVAGVLALVGGVLGPAVFLAVGEATERGGVDPALVRSVVAVLGWTPLGWAWSAPAEAAAGAAGPALVKLAAAAALLAGVLAAWAAALSRALVSGGGGSGSARTVGAARETALLARLEGSVTGAVTARCLRYWRRDSRYATAVVTLLVIPALVVALPVIVPLDRDLAALAVGPALAFVIGWTSHNDVALDGSAVWLHVSSGVPGRADRWGRSLALLVWGVPFALAVTVAGVAYAGQWALLPGLLGLAVAVIGAGQGVGAVSSALLPYRVPEPGANPFAMPPGSALASLLAQTATSALTLTLASPTLGLVLAAYLLPPGGLAVALSWTGLVVGAVTGPLALWLGVRGGGRVFERRGPELLASLSR